MHTRKRWPKTWWTVMPVACPSLSHVHPSVCVGCVSHANTHKSKLIYRFCFLVTAAWKEPYPGWVEGMNGPTGLIIGAARGKQLKNRWQYGTCAHMVIRFLVILFPFAQASYVQCTVIQTIRPTYYPWILQSMPSSQPHGHAAKMTTKASQLNSTTLHWHTTNRWLGARPSTRAANFSTKIHCVSHYGIQTARSNRTIGIICSVSFFSIICRRISLMDCWCWCARNHCKCDRTRFFFLCVNIKNGFRSMKLFNVLCFFSPLFPFLMCSIVWLAFRSAYRKD